MENTNNENEEAQDNLFESQVQFNNPSHSDKKNILPPVHPQQKINKHLQQKDKQLQIKETKTSSEEVRIQFPDRHQKKVRYRRQLQRSNFDLRTIELYPDDQLPCDEQSINVSKDQLQMMGKKIELYQVKMDHNDKKQNQYKINQQNQFQKKNSEKKRSKNSRMNEKEKQRNEHSSQFQTQQQFRYTDNLQPSQKQEYGMDKLTQEDSSSTSRFLNINFIAKIAIIVLMVICMSILTWYYHCIIFDKSCQNKKSISQPLIVSRNFQNNECFVINYEIHTLVETNQAKTLGRSNYTMYYCIKQMDTQGNLVLIGYLKRISEENLLSSPIEKQFFETEVALEGLLFANNNLNQQDPQTNSTIDLNSTETYELTDGNTTIQINQSLIEELTSKIVMFRFSVFRNGTINRIEFDKRLANETLGELPKMIKMFFPSLSLYLYAPKMQRLLQDSVGNNTQSNTTKLYGFEENSEGGKTLNSQIQILPSSPDDPLSQSQSNSAAFGEDGNLLAGNLEASVGVQSPPVELSADYVTHNVPNSVRISQNISILVQCVMKNLSRTHIAKFEGYFISQVLDKKRLLNFTEAELTSYIKNQSSKSSDHPTRRMLLQSDGSLKLFSKEKKITLLKTNAIGMAISLSAYAFIEIRMVELDQFRKQPIFQSQAGLLLNIGPFDYTQVIFNAQHQFEPLSLSFTLDQVEIFMDIIQPDFIISIIKIANLASQIQFNQKFLPQLLNLSRHINQILKIVSKSQSSLSNLTSELFSYLENIKKIVNSDGSNLISGKIKIISEIRSDIEQFFSLKFAQALLALKQVQSKLSIQQEKGQTLLQNYKQSKLQFAQPYLQDITYLLTPQILQQYHQQMLKAQPFFDFFQNLYQSSIQFETNLSQSYDFYRLGMKNTALTLSDAYYFAPNETFRKIIDIAESKIQILNYSFLEISKDLNDSQISAGEFLLQKIKSVENNLPFSVLQITTQYYKNLTDKVKEAVDPIAQALKGTCGICPPYFFFDPSCPYHDRNFSGVIAFQGLAQEIKGNLFPVQQISSRFIEFRNFLRDQIASNSSISQKYDNLIPQIYKFQGIQDEINNTKEALIKYTNRLLEDRDVVSVGQCDPATCENCFLNAVQKQLNQILYLIDQVSLFWAYFQDITRLRDLFNQITSFDSNLYDQLIDFTKLTPQVLNFYNENIKISSNIITLYQNAYSLKKSTTDKYLKGSSVKETLAQSFQIIKQWTMDYCQQNQTKQSQIDDIRQYFNSLSHKILNSNNNFLKQAFSISSDNLDLLANISFSEFTPLEFCDLNEAKEFIDQIDEYITDFNNFKIIERLFAKLEAQINTSYEVMKNFDEFRGKMAVSIKRIYNQDQFYGFLDDCAELTYRIRNETLRFGVQMVNLQQEGQMISLFTTVNQTQIDQIIKMMNSIKFPLNYLQMFRNIGKQIDKIALIVGSLNFQIIGTIKHLLQGIQFIKYAKQQIIDGDLQILTSFKTLTTSFLTVKQNVSQSTLLQIQSQFSKLNNALYNLILFPIEVYFLDYQNYFQKLIIKKNTYLKDIVSKTSFITKQFQLDLNDKSKIQIQQFNQIVQISINLIKSLKIGFLNQILQLIPDIEDTFQQFVRQFNNQVSSIQDYQSIVVKNLMKMKQAGNFILQLEHNIENIRDSILAKLKVKINERLKIIYSDPDIKQSFDSFPFRTNIKSVTQILWIDFKPTWNKVKPLISSIDQFIGGLSGTINQKIRSISQIKDTIGQVQGKIDMRINNIKESYDDIKYTFTKIQRLIFGILKNDLKQTVVGSINNIFDNIDAIFEQDLQKISDLAHFKFPSQLQEIIPIIDEVLKTYQIIKSLRVNIGNFINDQVSNILDSLTSTLFDKFQILKDAKNAIESLPDLTDPQSSLTIFQEYLKKEQIPILQLSFYIPTIIGPFCFSMGINFYYGAEINIQLKNFRSVDISISFGTGLELQANFGYGLPKIVEVGMYLKGTIVEVKVIPGFELQNIIPVQLIQQLVPIKEFKSVNRFALIAFLDIKIGAFSFETGGYITHISFRITWIDISFCIDINLFFFSINFCINFKLPLIQPTWDTLYFGYSFGGLELVQKRLFDFQMFSFNY